MSIGAAADTRLRNEAHQEVVSDMMVGGSEEIADRSSTRRLRSEPVGSGWIHAVSLSQVMDGQYARSATTELQDQIT